MKARTYLVILAIAAAVIGLSGCFQTTGPLAKFTATPLFAYPPLETTFDASASSSANEAIVNYEWNFGDGETGTGVIVTHTYEEKGIYEVTLMVTDSAGETGARSLAVEALNRYPTASFTLSPSTYIAAQQEARFDASGSSDPDGEIVQYLWSFGDGSTGEGMIVEHAFPFAPSGTGGWRPVITLTVVDENGGTSSTSRQIIVVGCPTC